MVQLFQNHPGLWFVVATLLPLASFVIVLLWLGTRLIGRRYRETAAGKAVYEALGGDTPVRGPAYVATAAIALSCVCSVAGFVQFLQRHPGDETQIAELETKLEGLKEQRENISRASAPNRWLEKTQEIRAVEEQIHEVESHWSGRFNWATVGTAPKPKDPDKETAQVWLPIWKPMTALSLGFRIDHLSGLMFVMVTFVATLIHLFSIGYMSDELQTDVEDHQVHTEFGHLRRPGRFGRFFLFLSLFCFSMLNLVLADNLFQVFISWELVGICSYLLISFYFERHSAGNAANKAFIVNRVGDAGFIIGLLIVWATFGTFNFQEIFAHLRAPNRDSHGPIALAGKIVRAEPIPADQLKEDERPEPGTRKLKVTGGANNAGGSEVLLYPLRWPDHYHGPRPGGEITVRDNPDWTDADPEDEQTTTMPYWLLVAAGLGLFLGCVGKSA
ncbi:MAG TPA: proton-conducting transporter membrane subunit, partial [Gemmataceae bacterium]|nr:proton-conducting transporter membrane subunit [Gemmataceae bacterium]